MDDSVVRDFCVRHAIFLVGNKLILIKIFNYKQRTRSAANKSRVDLGDTQIRPNSVMPFESCKLLNFIAYFDDGGNPGRHYESKEKEDFLLINA